MNPDNIIPAMDDPTAAAIAAAVTVALEGRRFRIRRIETASGPINAWARVGRRMIHASHALERKFK